MKWKVLGRGIQQNVTEGVFTRDAWYDYGSAAIGGALYPTIPTAIERVMGWDMSGWKGAITGLAVTSLLGLATGQAGMTCGAIGAFTAHMSYSVLNERVIYPIFGQYLFRWDPTASQTFADDVGQSALQAPALQEGAHMQTLPDGRQVPVYREEDMQADLAPGIPGGAAADTATGAAGGGMSDYTYQLPEASAGTAGTANALSGYTYSLPEVSLNDYVNAIPAAQSTLSGYTQTMPQTGSTRTDYGRTDYNRTSYEKTNYGRGFADEDSYADAYM